MNPLNLLILFVAHLLSLITALLPADALPKNRSHNRNTFAIYGFITVLSFLLASSSCMAQTYYVRPNSSHGGANNGTSYANAWQSFAHIDWRLLSSNLPNTLIVCGTHTLRLNVAGSGIDDAHRLTITGLCSEGSPGRISLSGTYSQGLFINTKKYISVEYIDVAGSTNTSGYPHASVASVDSSHIQLKRLTARDNALSNGFHLRRSTHVLADGVIAYNNFGHGIYVSGDAIAPSANNEVTNCSSYGNGRSGLKFEGTQTTLSNTRNTGHHCDLYGNGDGAYLVIGENLALYNNSIHDNRKTTRSSAYAEGYGIGVQQSKNVDIHSNNIANNRSDGVEVWGNSALRADNTQVHGNIIQGHALARNDDAISNGYECRTGYSKGCLVYSNVFIGNTKAMRLGNDPSGTSMAFNNTVVGGIYGIRFCGGGAGCGTTTAGWVVHNNIFERTTHAIYTNNTLASVTRSHNMYNSSDVVYNGVVYTGMAIRTFDSAALVMDPLLSADFSLLSASPAQRSGISVGQFTDLQDCPFATPPSLGAVEKCDIGVSYTY